MFKGHSAERNVQETNFENNGLVFNATHNISKFLGGFDQQNMLVDLEIRVDFPALKHKLFDLKTIRTLFSDFFYS